MPDERYRLAELREQRVDLHRQMDTIITTADTEERALSAEDTQTLERLEGEFRSLTTDIERRERLAGFDSHLTGGVPQPAEPAQSGQRSDPRNTEEYRAAMDSYLRGGRGALSDEQRSSLQVGVDADGGFTVAEEWSSLQDHLRENAVMRSLARVVSTTTGGTFHIPRVATDAAKPVITAENAPIADDAPEFDEVTLGAAKIPRIVKGSLEMVQDAGFNVSGFVAEELGRSLGLAADEQYFVGTGDGDPNPQGLFPGMTLGTGVTGVASIGYDELVKLKYSVTAPYRANAAWLMNDQTVASLQMLKDTTNRPLWEPNVKLGEPDLLLGKPLYTSQFAPEVAAGTRPIAFGDFYRAYWIRDVAGISIQFLDQLYAANDQVGWKGRLRTSGAIVDGRAVRGLSIAP